jgi:hypothetical protein
MVGGIECNAGFSIFSCSSKMRRAMQNLCFGGWCSRASRGPAAAPSPPTITVPRAPAVAAPLPPFSRATPIWMKVPSHRVMVPVAAVCVCRPVVWLYGLPRWFKRRDRGVAAHSHLSKLSECLGLLCSESPRARS